ncbi:ATP-grasp domain-containing protein [Amylibacter sp.]|nr:ATP-grasp domain-containing protein [Amylibacter sp.]
MSDYFWVIGGGLMQVPIIENLKLKSLKSIVTDGSSDCICANLADIFKKIDIFNITEHLKFVDELIRQDIKIVGVLSAGIDAPETMSRIGEKLGLPVVPSGISKLVNNKANFRKWMRNNQFPTPLFKEFQAEEFDKFYEFKNEIDYPFIIKNVNSSASRGTKIFYSHDLVEEKRIFSEAVKVSRSNSCLVESVWNGTEHTVETFWDISSKFHRLFITDRIFDYKTGFPIETGLVNPTRLTSFEQNQCYDLAEKISQKLGINIGAAKFDMIYTKDGPRVIEMTTRLSGGFDCQYLVPAATGMNVLSAAIDTSIGLRIKLDDITTTKNKVAVSGSLWPKSGTVIKIEGIEAANSLLTTDHVFMRIKVGDIVPIYENCADRTAIIICSDVTETRAVAALKKALSLIKVITK